MAPMDEDKSSTDGQTEQPANEPQTVDQYVNDIHSLQAQKKRKRIVAIIIVIVLLVAAVFGSMKIIKLAMSDPKETDQQTNQQPEQPTSSPISTETENHSSSQFFLNFDYPNDWEVNDDRVAGLLTVTSPQMDMPGPSGAMSGKVVFQIRAKTSKLPEFEDGNALAVTDSEKIKYTRPSQAQRGETYLSFLSYAGSASSGLIDGVFVTGDFGYKKDQAIPKVDIQKIDPIINVSFLACDGTCELAAAIPPSAWQQADFGQQIKKMIQSLHIN
jgi:hypothetical protein